MSLQGSPLRLTRTLERRKRSTQRINLVEGGDCTASQSMRICPANVYFVKACGCAATPASLPVKALGVEVGSSAVVSSILNPFSVPPEHEYSLGRDRTAARCCTWVVRYGWMLKLSHPREGQREDRHVDCHLLRYPRTSAQIEEEPKVRGETGVFGASVYPNAV